MNQRMKGILLMLPLISVFFLGDIVFTIFTLVLGVMGYNELKHAFSKKGIYLSEMIGLIFSVILYLISFTNPPKTVILALIVGLFLGMVMLLLQEKITIMDFAITVFSILYAFLPFWLISRIYVADGGIKYAVLVFIISFSTDIFALIFGKYFGKHKLIPHISPNKTIEGSAGGILATIIVGVIYGYFTGISMTWILPLSICGSLVAQMGDLFASTIKRYCGIKDFSNLIPGHGGVLDRFDSVNFVALLMILIPLI